MPPLRTFPVKPVKTERTHEENQERAYIAASRRSDRSLEARVESARRASEIHKRRTGRSLRVTEQDVINEEMYEEEDDDLPMQYRRLTAHLQTGSADFNRRLAAYLTNHVAMRSALDQAITHSYAEQFPNAPKFAHNYTNAFPSPLAMPGAAPHPATQQSPISPHAYRQAPYPMPGMPTYRPTHFRSASMASPMQSASPTFQNYPTTTNDISSPHLQRPASVPALADALPQPPTSTSAASSPTASKANSTPAKSPATSIKQSPMGPPSSTSHSSDPLQTGVGPFTMSLPQDSQMLLAGSLDPNDPFSSMLMSSGLMGSSYTFPPYAPTFGSSALYNAAHDMNSTLSPSALSINPAHTMMPGAAQPSFDQHDSFNLHLGDLKGVEFNPSATTQHSATATPATESGWDSFINDSSWAENAT